MSSPEGVKKAMLSNSLWLWFYEKKKGAPKNRGGGGVSTSFALG